SVMVSHIVMVTDARGHTAVVERAPGEPAILRTVDDPQRVALTNHFESALKDDPRNESVREHTSTLARRARLDEMLSAVEPGAGNVQGMLRMLRDHQCAEHAGHAEQASGPCPLGDRRTIDALIATHGIVADATDRVLWVSAGPHLSGRFVRFDLRTIFAEGHDPARDTEAETLPEDPILLDGRYESGREHAGISTFRKEGRAP
ncbi:MAG TPA: hypothetical protein VNO21_17180, partial [Polyangiaceae bacterium]|nr:hypothetical protein [Polyangiaceae bacterium]